MSALLCLACGVSALPAHLCSVGFREAVDLGIDQLEHGLLTDTEFHPDRQPDVCPTVSDSIMFGSLDVESPDVQKTTKAMVQPHVAMTSTLDVFELGASRRVPADSRVLEALYPTASATIR